MLRWTEDEAIAQRRQGRREGQAEQHRRSRSSTGSSASTSSRTASSPTPSTSWPNCPRAIRTNPWRHYKKKLQTLADLYIDKDRKVGQLLDHGLQPALPRQLGQRADLHRPPAARQAGATRQRRLLADRPAIGLRHRPRGRHLRPPAAGRPGGDQSQAPRVQ